MVAARNPLSRQVAIVGVGSTPYARAQDQSRGALTLRACIAALADAGLGAADIDGLAGSAFQVMPQYVQSGLGLPRLRWWATGQTPLALLLSDAANAVLAGACETALVYQSSMRTGSVSRGAHGDPIRAAPDPSRLFSPHHTGEFYVPYGGRTLQYAGYMRRYMHEYGVDRRAFGLAAVNNRTHAGSNPRAAQRSPLTLDDYLAAPIVRDPMCLFDMDYPVDGADALVVTTVDRARDLQRPPVLIDALTYGSPAQCHDDLYRDLTTTGLDVAAAALWEKTSLGRDDIDLLYVYDGFTVIMLRWIEALGFCEPGAAGRWLEAHWKSGADAAWYRDRVPVNVNGGNLSEGAVQGAGHLRDAVFQLRHDAGGRQVPNASVALLGMGGMFVNSSALVLVRDGAG